MVDGNRARTNRTFLCFALVGAVFGCALTALAITGETALLAQYQDAFAERGNRSLAIATRSSDPAAVPVAATEDYWLGDARDTPATLARFTGNEVLKRGDHLSLTIAGSVHRLEVVAVTALTDAGVRAALGVKSLEARLVTLRDVDKPAAPDLRLLVDGQGKSLDADVRLSRAHEL